MGSLDACLYGGSQFPEPLLDMHGQPSPRQSDHAGVAFWIGLAPPDMNHHPLCTLLQVINVRGSSSLATYGQLGLSFKAQLGSEKAAEFEHR